MQRCAQWINSYKVNGCNSNKDTQSGLLTTCTIQCNSNKDTQSGLIFVHVNVCDSHKDVRNG